MNRQFSEGSRRLFRDSYQPFTNALLVATIGLFLLEFGGAPVSEWLGAVVPQAWVQPWRILTYPLLAGGIWGLLFNGFLLFQVGGSLERGWGTKTIAIFTVCLAVINALAFTLAASVAHLMLFPVPGNQVLWALAVGFCTINPDESINFYGIIPIKTRYIALGICLITFFSFGAGNIFLGLMALVPCGFAVLWVKQDWAYRIGQGNFPVTMKIPHISKAPNLRLVPPISKPKDDRFSVRDLNPARWLKKRAEKKKFEKLMNDD